MDKLIHLHRHSEFSLLDGTGTAAQYAEQARKLEMPAMALTDHGTLSGALHHYQACKDVGVMPILGMEAYFKPNRHLKDDVNKEYYHLVLLAKDIKGWHNLMRLSSEAYSSGFYYKPCVDFELLEQYNEGIICSTACISSYLNTNIIRANDTEVIGTINRLQKAFGDDLFIEIMPHDYDDQRTLNLELINIAGRHSIPLIATVDAHYPYKEWAPTQDVMLMLATGQTNSKRQAKKDSGEDVYKFDCDTLFIMDQKEVEDAFAKNHPNLPEYVVQEAIVNTTEVMNRCVPFMISKKQKMPKVDIDAEKVVWDWCQEGMKEKGFIGEKDYEERLEYEFGVLKKNEVLDYFAIVGDLCRWADSQSIRMGIGRGSAAGCLVSYLIGITSLDPLKNDLLFERFLNPDRKGMPDIDLDFQSDRRDEVKQYLADKYGVDHVADICSHQTYKPRATLQKISMVYDDQITYMDAREVITTMDEKADDPLEDLRRFNPKIDDYADRFPEAWEHATRIQGQVHTLSKHAGGVVITDRPVSEYMPTMRGKKGETLTQWGARADFNIIDDYGFMKIDVLGLKSLAMQEYACDLIEKRYGERPKLNSLPFLRDPYAIDERVLRGFSQGHVLGVFQFTGSPGFGKLVKSFNPTWLGDLGAANAIYRPGPLGGGVHEQYAKRKDGTAEWSPYHERAEAALAPTYGLIVYQEQIMRLSKDMADFTGGEADALRKAISKEYRLGIKHVEEKLEREGYKEKWWQGCRDNGIKDAIIKEIYRNFLAFGGYGFNKSHAYAYAAQSAQDMWLKTHYPTEFYAALMTFDPDLAMKVIRESRMFDVQVKAPDINKSGFGFTVDDNSILFGLKAVRNMGDVGVKAVLEAQPFRSYEDFCERIAPRHVNKRAKESLIAAGAFDQYKARKDWMFDQVYEGELEALGVCISQVQAMNTCFDLIKERSHTLEQFQEMQDDDGVVIGGELIERREIKIQNGRKNMGFIEVQFGSATFNCTLFADEWKEFRDLVDKNALGRVVMIQGRKNTYNGKESIIVDNMCSVEELAMAMSQEKEEDDSDRREEDN